MFPALCFVALFLGQDSLPSGPAVGEKLGDFKIKGVFGSQAGKEFSFAEATKGQPTLLLFVHKLSRPAVKLLRPVDDFAAKHDKLAAHIIFLAEDKEETEALVKRAQGSLNLHLPIGICLDGKTGPESYGLNDMVAITILLAKDGKVTHNFAFVDPNDTDSPRVVAALAKLLGKEK
jgi:hypothetical protein